MSSKTKNKKRNAVSQVLFLFIMSLLVLFILITGFSIHQDAELPEYIPPVTINEQVPHFELIHIEYFLKGLKFYKLHSNLFDMQPAKIKFVVAQANQIFYVIITSNLFKVSDQELFDEPDLIIYLEGDTLVRLINDVNNRALIQKLIDSGDIRLNYNSNKFTLFMKGFYATLLRP